MAEKTYTVSQLSKIAGVSVRTLHHYDEIEILKPRRRSSNGYREYTREHLAQLQQIIIYRELDFRLEEITEILNSEDFDLLGTLGKQREMLVKRQQQTQSMIEGIDMTIDMLNGKNNFEKFFKRFPGESLEKVNEMILEAKGEEKLNEVYSRYASLSEEDIAYEQTENEKWVSKYKLLLSHPVDSEEVQKLVQENYISGNRLLRKICVDGEFDGVGYDHYINSVEKILFEPPLRALYEHYHEGFAEHLHEAMMFFAENTLRHRVEFFKSL